jgi:pentatricopeptide repeat protein
MLGKEHPSTLTIMNYLAGSLSEQGKYEEAEEMYRQALGLRETVRGKRKGKGLHKHTPYDLSSYP